jgi:ribonuclease T2
MPQHAPSEVKSQEACLNRLFLSIALFVAVSTVPAFAQVKMDGSFKAAQACPALASIKKGTNPGDVSIAAGTAYRLLGKNKDQATHYWIEVPSAAPVQRWVAIACGSTDGSAQVGAIPSTGAAINTPNGTVKPKPKPKKANDGIPFYVLALSWEPAFCELKPDKPECKALTSNSFLATWPLAATTTQRVLWRCPRCCGA